MLNQTINPNKSFNQPGFEQVKVLYDEKKSSYEKNHIETKNDKEIFKEAINDIFEKEINKMPLVNKNIQIKSFSVFANDDDDDEKRTNKKNKPKRPVFFVWRGRPDLNRRPPA